MGTSMAQTVTYSKASTSHHCTVSHTDADQTFYFCTCNAKVVTSAATAFTAAVIANTLFTAAATTFPTCKAALSSDNHTATWTHSAGDPWTRSTAKYSATATLAGDAAAAGNSSTVFHTVTTANTAAAATKDIDNTSANTTVSSAATAHTANSQQTSQQQTS